MSMNRLLWFELYIVKQVRILLQLAPQAREIEDLCRLRHRCHYTDNRGDHGYRMWFLGTKTNSSVLPRRNYSH
jgi:hypothetical protein